MAVQTTSSRHQQKPPAFLFYVNDWITGTLTLSLEEKGAYITLLAYAWDHDGRIPNNEQTIAKLLGSSLRVSRRIFAAVQDKFRLSRNGYWTNPKLSRIKRERTQFLTIRSKGGAARARHARRIAGKFSPAAAGSLLVADHQQPTKSSSSLSFSSTEVQRRPAAACAQPVEKSTPWRRGVALAHVIIEAHPREQWTAEFKARARDQGLAYDQPGGRDGRPLYARVLDYVEQARAKRS